MFYEGAQGLLRVLVAGVLAYAALVVLLRVSGKRTLSKMNAFDLVVTVALGSTLASIITSKDVAIAEGVLALGLLITLQFVVAWLCVRSRRVRELVKSEPQLLFHEGQFLSEALARERVTEDEVRSAARLKGICSLERVHSVVLETSGEFSVSERRESAGSAQGL
jgi:uncharacterized membrane protein YcaP (DUF421 family)